MSGFHLWPRVPARVEAPAGSLWACPPPPPPTAGAAGGCLLIGPRHAEHFRGSGGLRALAGENPGLLEGPTGPAAGAPCLAKFRGTRSPWGMWGAVGGQWSGLRLSRGGPDRDCDAGAEPRPPGLTSSGPCQPAHAATAGPLEPPGPRCRGRAGHRSGPGNLGGVNEMPSVGGGPQLPLVRKGRIWGGRSPVGVVWLGEEETPSLEGHSRSRGGGGRSPSRAAQLAM